MTSIKGVSCITWIRGGAAVSHGKCDTAPNLSCFSRNIMRISWVQVPATSMAVQPYSSIVHGVEVCFSFC